MVRIASVLLLLLCLGPNAWAIRNNGFDLTGSLVPPHRIVSGGPAKDGIPALDQPAFVDANDARFLTPADRVLGVRLNGIAKAYPIGILNWHEIVNDRFGKRPVVVSFCPLCGTGMVFDARVAGTARTFGVSGLLYNSDVLLYDRQSESLWSQIDRRALAGPLKGETLTMLPVSHTSWADWRQRHPDTLVLSDQTGFLRDYRRDPYAGYGTSPSLYFAVSNTDPRHHPKERVVGLQIGKAFAAYPFAELNKAGGTVADTVGGVPVTVYFDAQHQTGRVTGADGKEIPTVIAFWFAWTAFHPNTAVFTAR